jgi:hypothetical protein
MKAMRVRRLARGLRERGGLRIGQLDDRDLSRMNVVRTYVMGLIDWRTAGHAPLAAVGTIARMRSAALKALQVAPVRDH